MPAVAAIGVEEDDRLLHEPPAPPARAASTRWADASRRSRSCSAQPRRAARRQGSGGGWPGSRPRRGRRPPRRPRPGRTGRRRRAWPPPPRPAARFAGLRARAVTSWPACTRRRAVGRPTAPVRPGQEDPHGPVDCDRPITGEHAPHRAVATVEAQRRCADRGIRCTCCASVPCVDTLCGDGPSFAGAANDNGGMRDAAQVAAIVAAGVLVTRTGGDAAGAAPDGAAAPRPGRGRRPLRRVQGQARPRRGRRRARHGRRPPRHGHLAPADGQADVEVVLQRGRPTSWPTEGVDLELKEVDGESVAELSTRRPPEGFDVFRPYSGSGGLKEEYEQIAADHPDIVKLVMIGQTVQGQDIIALKVTRRANQDQRRQPAGDAVLGRPARPRVDHARDDPAARPPRGRRLRHRPDHRRPRRPDRAVVRARRQPRRLRLDVRARPAAVAQEPA